MSRYISELPFGTKVNIIELNGGEKQLVPYVVIGVGNYNTEDFTGNPYGGDKVLLLRYRLTKGTAPSNAIYSGSQTDIFCQNYIEKFDFATQSCIAQSTVFCESLSESYTVSRKIFIPSADELGFRGNAESGRIALPNRGVYLNSELISMADDSGAVIVSWFTRTPNTETHAFSIFNGRSWTDSDAYAKYSNSRAVRICFNVYADCKVSAVPNPDGSYNLLPEVDISVGSGNTGLRSASELEINSSIFLSAFPGNGDFLFTKSASGWLYEGGDITLSDCGIALKSGVSVAVGDSFTVSVSLKKKLLYFHCLMGRAEARPRQAKITAEVSGSPATNITLICNNYLDDSPSWELASLGKGHTFSNINKAASSWAVGLKMQLTGENTISVSDLKGVMLCDDPASADTVGEGEEAESE